MSDAGPAHDVIALVDHPLSPYAQKVRIALREKGLAFTSEVRVARKGGGSLSTINPRSEVPVLQHEGSRIFDSTIIMEYLEERFPSPALMPSTAAARARARMIEDICDSLWEAINWGVMEVRYFGRGGDALRAKLMASAQADVNAMYAWLDKQLGDALWLGGEAFGMADAAALPHVTMSAMLDLPMPEMPQLKAWLARSMERPSVAVTVEDARAALEQMAKVGDLLKAGNFSRQYRDHRLEWMIRAGGLDVVIDGLAQGNIRFTDLGHFASWGEAAD